MLTSLGQIYFKKSSPVFQCRTNAFSHEKHRSKWGKVARGEDQSLNPLNQLMRPHIWAPTPSLCILMFLLIRTCLLSWNFHFWSTVAFTCVVHIIRTRPNTAVPFHTKPFAWIFASLIGQDVLLEMRFLNRSSILSQLSKKLQKRCGYGRWFGRKMCSSFSGWVTSRLDHVLTKNEPVQRWFEKAPCRSWYAFLTSIFVWTGTNAAVANSSLMEWT